MEPSSERNYSKLEWFFYIIILPVLFVAIITITLLWFLDYDVKANLLRAFNKIPGIEKLIDDEQLIEDGYRSTNPSKEEMQLTLEELKVSLDEKELMLTQAEEVALNKDEEIARLNAQVEELEAKLDEKDTSDVAREDEIAELAKVYSNMNPKNAANIISNLGTEEAVLILSQMNVDSKSKILEKMDPKTAADISILLKDQEYSKDQDIKALQERIEILVQEIDQLKNN